MRSALRFMFVAIDATGNVIETHNPPRDLKEWLDHATRVETFHVARESKFA